MERIWLAAAESSGDALAAALALELRERWPGVALRGMAGPRMEAAGIERAVAPVTGAVGIVEGAARVPAALRALRLAERDIRRWAPQVLVTVDSPSLMLRLAARVPEVRRLQWVAPQLWAWRPGRARRIARSLDTICCLLPFEPAWFADQPVRAVHTGHPAAGTRPSIAEEPPVVALLPGSRPEEVRRLWPALRDVAAALRAARPGLRLRVGLAPGVALSGLDADFVTGLSAAVTGASAAVVCSGTATVEVAAHGVPQVVVYRAHPVSFGIGRALVRGVRHVALPNILAGRTVIPEHLQSLDPTAIAADVLRQLDTPDAQVDALAPVLRSLAPEGAVGRVADEVERLS